MTDHSSQAMSDLQTTLWPFGWQPASRIYFANLGAADQFFETSGTVSKPPAVSEAQRGHHELAT